MEGQERRSAHRFKHNITVQFRGGSGITRDYSSSGIYFYTDRPFQVGEPFEFVLTLDSPSVSKPVRAHCFGDILRVEPQSERYGIAASILTHTIAYDRDTSDMA